MTLYPLVSLLTPSQGPNTLPMLPDTFERKVVVAPFPKASLLSRDITYIYIYLCMYWIYLGANQRRSARSFPARNKRCGILSWPFHFALGLPRFLVFSCLMRFLFVLRRAWLSWACFPSCCNSSNHSCSSFCCGRSPPPTPMTVKSFWQTWVQLFQWFLLASLGWLTHQVGLVAWNHPRAERSRRCPMEHVET